MQLQITDYMFILHRNNLIMDNTLLHANFF